MTAMREIFSKDALELIRDSIHCPKARGQPLSPMKASCESTYLRFVLLSCMNRRLGAVDGDANAWNGSCLNGCWLLWASGVLQRKQKRYLEVDMVYREKT
ncbi:hypothetical protein RB195_009298 [Necator americanus]|uniref:Uncharacterized protein n=1 Tax=Necator americanus TaxID=51031 RepID=A0ABR1CSQ7_NECAM